MTQSNEPTIDQMNSTIARFMGITPVPAGTKRLGDIKPPHESIVFLNYHEKWELLMPVVEKIETIGNTIRIYTGHTTICTKEGLPVCQMVDESKINATHKAVYQFITWYNQQNATTNESKPE